MVKPLPTFTALGESPAPRPAPPGGQVDTRGLDAKLHEDAAIVSAGAHVVAGSGELMAAQDRLDTTIAEDAFNKLRDSQVDLTNGPEGFANKKGGDAVTEPLLKDYSDKFTQSQKQISEGLKNDNQKAKFNARAAIAGVQFKQDILKHVYAESAVYGREVLEGTIKTEVRNAQVNWDDPFAVKMSSDRIDAAIDNMAKQHGWPKAQTDAMRQTAETQIATSVISSAIENGDTGYAKDYFDAHRESIDLPTQKLLLKTIEVGTQKNLVNGYQAQFLGVRDDVKGLDALETRVTADKELDDGSKNVLLGRIMGRRDVVEARAERAQIQQERTIQKGIDQVNSLTLQGYEPTVEQMQPIVEMAKGTELEGAAQAMVATANATRNFRLAPPAQQEAYLTQLEAKVREDPTKFDVNVVKHFRTIYDNQQRAIQDDPVSFAVRQGLAPPTMVDLSKPAEAADAIAERAAVSRSMVARYQAPYKILTKEEKDLLVGVLKNTPTQGKRDYFASLAQATGNDPQTYSAIMAQLAPDDPVTAIAGIYAGRGIKDDKGNQVADLILRGQAILHPNRKEDGSPDKGKLWPMPTGKDELTMHQLFADYERDAFAGHPQARSDHYQTAVSIYAAKSAEAGDASGVIDSTRWKDSIKLATGGIDRYNGKSIVLPWGYDYSQFKDGVRNQIETIGASGRLNADTPPSKLRDLPLENIGDGRYVFRAGDGILIGKDKLPIIIDLNQVGPPAGGRMKTPGSQQDVERGARAADQPRPAAASPFRRPAQPGTGE